MRRILCRGLSGGAALCLLLWCSAFFPGVSGEQQPDASREARELFERAEQHRRDGELEEAKALYRESIQKDPHYAPAHRFLGEMLLRLGESRAAVQVLEEAVSRFGDQVELLLVLGVAYGPEGRIAESVRTLRRVVEIEPGRELGWVNLGASLEQLGALDEAREAFEKALELEPTLVFAHNRLGRLLMGAGETAAARKHLERALELDSASTDARYHLSRVLRAEGRLGEAEALFHEAFGLPPPGVLTSPELLAKGRELSARHCSGCHLEPRPESLPRRSWPFVAVWMGNYLGFPNLSGPFANLVSRAQIPAQPLLSREDFHAIYHHLVDSAPLAPPAQKRKPEPLEGSSLFRARVGPHLEVDSPWITMLHVDEEEGRLFVGEGLPPRLSLFSREDRLLQSFPLESQPVALQTSSQGFDLTLIGDFDVDRRKGQVVRFHRKGEGYAAETALRDYFRTAYARFADLTGNGREDLVVCGFGDFDRGRLAWFENQGGGRFREHVLMDRSGALRAEIRDLTGNGYADLLVLMAQARNELILFENLGGGRFRSRQLMEQFPGFGYNDFLLADFNRDGHPDLLTVNGNNMEIEEPPLRNYHGLRVYLNDGKLNFTQAYFYPMYGALRAVAGDFTGNGHLDVAAISFFPDWEADLPETFVFLRNKGGLRFRPYTLKEAHWGRWLSLAAGDLTGDGRLDLVLGNAFVLRGIAPRAQSVFIQQFEKTPRVLILEGVRPTEGSEKGN